MSEIGSDSPDAMRITGGSPSGSPDDIWKPGFAAPTAADRAEGIGASSPASVRLPADTPSAAPDVDVWSVYGSEGAGDGANPTVAFDAVAFDGEYPELDLTPTTDGRPHRAGRMAVLTAAGVVLLGALGWAATASDGDSGDTDSTEVVEDGFGPEPPPGLDDIDPDGPTVPVTIDDDALTTIPVTVDDNAPTTAPSPDSPTATLPPAPDATTGPAVAPTPTPGVPSTGTIPGTGGDGSTGTNGTGGGGTIPGTGGDATGGTGGGGTGTGGGDGSGGTGGTTPGTGGGGTPPTTAPPTTAPPTTAPPTTAPPTTAPPTTAPPTTAPPTTAPPTTAAPIDTRVPFIPRNAVLASLSSAVASVQNDASLPAGIYTVRGQLRTVNEGNSADPFDGSAQVELCVDPPNPGAAPRRTLLFTMVYNGETFQVSSSPDGNSCPNIDDSSPATVLTRTVTR